MAAPIWESKGDSGRATTPRGGRRREAERESAAEEGAQSGRRRATRARLVRVDLGAKGDGEEDGGVDLGRERRGEAKGDGEEDGGARRSARRGTADAVRPFCPCVRQRRLREVGTRE